MVHMDTGAAVPAHTWTAGKWATLRSKLQHTPMFSFSDTLVCCEAAVGFVPCCLAREEGKEESRPEGRDDGELEEEEEGGGGR